ncbi:MAG: IS110 family transposase [Armatimonadota bacterium]
MQYIAFDAHKHYTLASVERADGRIVREERIPHERGALRRFLRRCERDSPVAVETTGNWYWIVDEIEGARCVPRLVHARKAKLMLGMINKTDKLDARGLNRLQRTGTLPTVWIPPGELRDQRDLPRTRMVLVRQRTQLKNRIHATLAKYALTVPEVSDLFGRRGRDLLRQRLPELPPQTAYTTRRLLEQVEALDRQVGLFEQRMQEIFEPTPEIELVMTLPGVGFILGIVIALEVGDVTRFASCEKVAAYAGTTARVHATGGKTRYGRLRPDVNHYLRWAFVEAANVICLLRGRWPDRHVSRLYERIARRRGHHKAIGAVARHLAEATYWMLTKREPYREPRSLQVRPAKPGLVHGGVSARRP